MGAYLGPATCSEGTARAEAMSYASGFLSAGPESVKVVTVILFSVRVRVEQLIICPGLDSVLRPTASQTCSQMSQTPDSAWCSAAAAARQATLFSSSGMLHISRVSSATLSQLCATSCLHVLAAVLLVTNSAQLQPIAHALAIDLYLKTNTKFERTTSSVHSAVSSSTGVADLLSRAENVRYLPSLLLCVVHCLVSYISSRAASTKVLLHPCGHFSANAG